MLGWGMLAKPIAAMIWVLSGYVVHLATAEEPVKTLEPFEVIDWTVAVPEPAGTYETVVSPLDAEPRIDLQSRNLAEAQGDIAVRGGIFESTGIRLGPVTILDPQTGHYTTELPIDPGMLGRLDVLTGVANSANGFNSTVATLHFGWAPVVAGAELTGGVGSDGLAHGRARGALHRGLENGGSMGMELSVASSESKGTLPGGSHRFVQASGRIRISDGAGVTDVVAGYQSKFFQWPYLYALEPLHALVDSNGIESENLQTTLVLVQHEREWAAGSVSIAGYYRRNRDDYEFDIDRPGLFNAYQHETEVWGAGVDGVWERGPLTWRASAQVTTDSIDSTALVFGPFSSRVLGHAAVTAQVVLKESAGRLMTMTAGIGADGSNRDEDGFTGMLELVSWGGFSANGRWGWRIGYAGSSQVPGYTAVASNPAAGLFRGEAGLRRETSHNWEAGLSWSRDDLRIDLSVFYRRDDDLVDWVYDSAAVPFGARFAANVDIEVAGVEVFTGCRLGVTEWRAGYAFLEKGADYGASSNDVDASFYALNFPRHRLTLSGIVQAGRSWRIRMDHELREQADNALRTSGDKAVISAVSAAYAPRRWKHLEAGIVIRNAWDQAFEEVPGVPGAGRRVSGFAKVRW